MQVQLGLPPATHDYGFKLWPQNHRILNLLILGAVASHFFQTHWN